MVYYIFGHKNPDTDAVCSSIVYASYLKSEGIGCEVVKLNSMNKETKFVLKKFNVDFPITKTSFEAGSEVVLVDHNEKAQSIENIDELKIREVIDHHKFNLITNEPVYIRAEPLGSTCTIVAKKMFEEGKVISKQEAGILISGIISDTLFFRSPTSTSEDKDIMNKLNEIVGIDDLDKYSLEMFDAKSELGDISVEDLIKLDYKAYKSGDKTFGIGVLETTQPRYALQRKDEIVAKLREMKNMEGLDALFLSIVDILNEQNITMFPSEYEKELLQRVFNARIEDDLAYLGPLLSRKKQIAPVIEKGIL